MITRYRRLLPNILLANVAPVLVYWIIRPHTASDADALALVTVFPLVDIGLQGARRRRLDLFGVVGLAGIAIGFAGTPLAHGDPLMLKLKGVIPTAAIGLICLGSLIAPRPVMFYVGREFETAGDPVKVVAYNAEWFQPGRPHDYRVVTAVWGLGLLGEAGVTVLLATSLSTQAFLADSELVSWGGLLCMLYFTQAYSNRVRAALPTPPGPRRCLSDMPEARRPDRHHKSHKAAGAH